MKIFICIDNDKGMLFNNRRQSRDSKLLEKIAEIVQNNKLWITEFSKNLFENDVVIDNDMLDKALEEDFCFVENLELSLYIEKITEIYLFHWNRSYPSDFKLNLDMNTNFKLINTEDFAGSSHEKITLEVWTND